MAAIVDSYIRWPVWKKAALVLVFVAAIGAVFFFVFYKPNMQKLDGLRKKHSELDATFKKKQKYANELPRIKEEVAELDRKLEIALAKLPTSEEIPKLLKNVSNIGVEGGLEFLLFKPGDIKPVADKTGEYFYAEVPLKIENRGSFMELSTFFDRVGRLPRIVTINDIVVGSPEFVTGKPPQLTATYTATTFKFLPPEERPKKEENGKKGKRRSGKRK